jgi:DeoR/GlpR family transcriptional regulator of sugar metabolism
MLIKRMQIICDRLEAEGSVDIRSLSKELCVTEKTIRQDLIKMENMDLLERVHGGAIAKHGVNNIYPIVDRRKYHTNEKERIALAAAQMVYDGDIVFLDNGMTIQEMAKQIKDKQIIVITNDVQIVNELRNSDKVCLYASGGKVRKEGGFCSFIGPDAIRMIRQKHVNKAFLGTSSISVEKGLMTFSEEEAEVKRAIIASAQKNICLADSTKFNKQAFVRFADVSDIDIVITDSGIDSQCKQDLEEGGIKVLAV